MARLNHSRRRPCASQWRSNAPTQAYAKLLDSANRAITGSTTARRCRLSSRPTIQPATMVSDSSQALMFTNCSAAPCQKPTSMRAASASPSWPLWLSFQASHTR